MSNPKHRLRVTRIAPRAKAWLQETQHAHVLYSFERVINLVNQEGNVLALADDLIGAGPISLVLELGEFPEDIQVGENLLVFENGLWLGDWLIDAEEAELWSPTPDWKTLVSQGEKIHWALPFIKDLLTKHAKPDSIAHLVLDPLASSPLPAKILQAAEQHVPLLLSGIRQNDPKSISRAAKGLAGIGPGLTPAGDDLLLGTIHGIWATRLETEAIALSTAIARTAVPRTHVLSAAWLEAAASGEAAEPWHALIDAIAARNQTELHKAVMTVLPTGHTSGSDALGGFLGVIEATQM